MSKKILLLLGILLLIGLLVLGIILLRKKEKPVPPPAPPTPSAKISATFSSVKRPVDEKILFPILTGDEQKILYFSENDQAFCLLNLKESKREILFKVNLQPVANIVYSPNQESAIIQTAVAQEGIFDNWLVNLENKTVKQANKYINTVAFSPKSDKIVYHYFEWGKNINTISVANPDGSNWVTLKEVNCENCQVGWVNDKEVYYVPLAYEASGSNLYKINIETKQDSELVGKEEGGRAKFFNGKALYEIFDEKTKEYFLGIMKDKERKNLKIATNLNKVVISQDEKSTIAAFWDDDKKTDQFIKIGLEKEELIEIQYDNKGLTIDAKNLMLTKDGKSLYFTAEDILYSLSFQ